MHLETENLIRSWPSAWAEKKTVQSLQTLKFNCSDARSPTDSVRCLNPESRLVRLSFGDKSPSVGFPVLVDRCDWVDVLSFAFCSGHDRGKDRRPTRSLRTGSRRPTRDKPVSTNGTRDGNRPIQHDDSPSDHVSEIAHNAESANRNRNAFTVTHPTLVTMPPGLHAFLGGRACALPLGFLAERCKPFCTPSTEALRNHFCLHHPISFRSLEFGREMIERKPRRRHHRNQHSQPTHTRGN